MDQAQAFPLLPDAPIEVQPEQGFLPDAPQEQQPVVPKNAPEIAAQLTMALGGDTPFQERFATNLSAVKAGGERPLLAQVLEQEQLDQIEGARSLALAYAQQRDAAGLRAAAEHASNLERTSASMSPDTHPVEAGKAAAQRALEGMVGTQYANRVYSNMDQLDKQLEQSAGDVAIRNSAARAAAQMGEEATLWEKVKAFGRAIIPGMENVLLANAVSKAMGGGVAFDPMTAVTEFRNLTLGMQPQERDEFLKKLIGELSTNKAVKAEQLRAIAELTKEENFGRWAMDAMNVDVAAALFGATARIIRKGVPLKAVKDTAGEKEAGKLAATDLTTKAEITGMSDTELVARTIAGGVSPLEADPAMLRGLAPHAQEQLKQDWDTLLTSVKERLNASGMAPEEVQAAAAKIRESYMRPTNKSVYAVEFGEASADGQQLTVLWQKHDGSAFLSREEADAYARERGLTNYEVVPKNSADAPIRMETASAGAPDIDEELLQISVEVNDLKAARKELLKEAEKLLKSGEEGSLEGAFILKQKAQAFDELIKNAKTIKTYGDVEDWWKHHGIYTGADDVPPPQAQPKLLAKISSSSEQDLGKLLKGESKQDIYELFQHQQLVGESPAMKEIFETYAEGLSKGHSSISLQRVLGTLSKKAEDHSYRLLAKEMLNRSQHQWSKIPTRLTRGSPTPRSQTAIGGYFSDTDTITIRASHLRNAGRFQEETFLHEAIHAWTVSALQIMQGDPEMAMKLLTKPQRIAAGDINTLWERMSRHEAAFGPALDKPQRLHYALQNDRELVAYGLTDPEIRKYLSQIKLKDLGYNEQGSVWDKLWTAIKSLLGFKAADDSALAKLVDSTARLVEGQTEEARMAMPTGFKSGRYIPPSSAHAAESSEWLVRQQRTDPLSYDAIGKFSQKDIDSMVWVAVDPKHGASEQALEARVVGVHGEAKVKQALINYITPYYKGVSKEGKQRIQALLEEGDAFSNAGTVGKEFTATEAMARGLSETEATAYLATRQLRMAMYHIRNGEMVRHLRAQGFKEIELVGTGQKTAGHVLSVEEAEGKHTGRYIYDATLKDNINMSPEEMREAYAGGKRVIRLAQPVTLDGELRQTFLVDNSVAKSRDILTALHYRPGEYARIYTDEYFITMKRKTVVDGEVQEMTDTIRTAASQREAEEFVDRVGKAVKLIQSVGVKPKFKMVSSESGLRVKPIGMSDVPKNTQDAELSHLIGQYFDLDEFRAAVRNGDFEGAEGFAYHYTRNQQEYLNGSVNEALANGRLFTSKRSDRLYSVDRSRENTMGVYESLEAEITNISRVANITQWREQMVRRWMNTFGELLPQHTGNDIADFYAAAGAKFTKGTQEALFAERTHKYIMRQIGLETSEERYWKTLTRRFTERFLSGGEKVEAVGAAMRKRGLLDLVRGVNFNLTLGMFNPAQLIVQANGAATAVILSPLYGLAAAKTFPLLRMALMSDNPSVWRGLAKFDIGGNSDEFVKLVQAVKQTGILDNLRSTALYNMETGVHNIFNAYPSRALGQHAFFFNRGEEFSRLISFDVARREWQAAHKGQAATGPMLTLYRGESAANQAGGQWWTTNRAKAARYGTVQEVQLPEALARRHSAQGHHGADEFVFGNKRPPELAASVTGDWTSKEALAQIVVRMDDLTQNMTRANLARFQEGLASIPLQFAQYNIKLAANIMSALLGKGEGRGFTKGEALRLMAGHIMLYGAAGNGLSWMVDEMLSDDQKNTLSVDEKTYLGQGLVGGLLAQVGEWFTGERTNVALGKRLGSFDYYQQLGESLFTDPKNIFEALMGPTAGTAKRLGVVGDVAYLWWRDPELSGEDIMRGLAAVGLEQMSTTRNLSKAYLYNLHSNKLMSAKGVPMAQLTGPEVVAQALGFQPTAALDLSQMIKSKKDHDEALAGIADLIYSTQKTIMQARLEGNDTYADEQHKLLQVLWPENAGDMMEVRRRIVDKLYPHDTMMKKMLGDYLIKGQTYSKPLLVTEQPRNQ